MPIASPASVGADTPLVFIELGVAVIGLALLARVASRWGFSTIPFYLLAGLAFGNGGVAPLRFSEGFVHLGAEIGVVLLLFMLGLEYTGHELGGQLRSGLRGGLIDAALNFTPGLLAGLWLGWSPLAAILLGGVTYNSSSGVIAKLLGEMGRLHHPDTRIVVTLLVLEDLAMAGYLPAIAVLLGGQGGLAAVAGVLVAALVVGVGLFTAVRHGEWLSRLVGHDSDEVLLFTTLGLVLLVAGVSQRLHVSASIGAFLVGLGLSGPIAKRAGGLVGPMRDLFSALFFLFFGLEIDPARLPPVLGVALALAAVTAATKLATGWWAGRLAGLGTRAALRAGAALIARGEFSIVIAGMGAAAGVESGLAPVASAYVMLLAVAGPVVVKLAGPGRSP
jgi:CPA2 family monovalent cation:H+ antiporter-2